MKASEKTLVIKNKSSRIKDIGKGDWLFVIAVYSMLIAFFCIVLYPLIFVVSASLSAPMAVVCGEMLIWPVGFTLDGYRYVMSYSDIWTGYMNTVFYTVAGTVLNLAVTLTCAYSLSRKDMVGRNFFMTLFVITMYFSGGLIPTYLNYLSFDLINKRAIMLIDGMVWAYCIIISRTFFVTTIPWELQESAKIDGCGDFMMFLRIVLPLSMPIVVVMTLYYGVGHWNSYFSAMIYLQDRNLYPLQMFLREILVQSKLTTSSFTSGMTNPEEVEALIEQANTANILKYAVIVISTVPMMLIYPWMQKFFAKGILIGSVKG